jgi:N-carbamoylputrescine amidase
LIQASNACSIEEPIEKIKQANIEKNLRFIDEAQRRADSLHARGVYHALLLRRTGASLVRSCRKIPDGPTVTLIRKLLKHGMVVIVPICEEEITALLQYRRGYRRGRQISGQVSKEPYPAHQTGLREKYYFKPGNLGYPTFETAFARIGVYICYDRHFPKEPGARTERRRDRFNPSATVAGLSSICGAEQPAHAVANGYFVGAINRVGHEQPWDIGEFYGKSYFCNPRGKIIAQASRDSDELVVADLDLDQIREVRNVWQFFRDRRPETYGALVKE